MKSDYKFSLLADPLISNKFILTGDFNSFFDSDSSVSVLKTIDRGFVIKKDDSFFYNKIPFRFGFISEVKPDKKLWICNMYKTTKLQPFLLTMIGYNWNANVISNKRFICSVYIGHYDNIEASEKKILVLCRTPFDSKNAKHYSSFENLLLKHPDYEGSYFPDEYHQFHVFKIPKNHLKNYDLLLSGLWSKIPEEFKQQVIQFNNYLNNEKGKCYQILYRTENLRLQLSEKLKIDIPKTNELYDRPEYEEEVYFDTMAINKTNVRLNIDLKELFTNLNNEPNELSANRV